ncbi:MAG: DNA polymerase III subunit gamma/tau [Chloroflexi bacterium]|nr:DNA polymerase III subunit gamma/tau [Chloroflexota bacterium]
MTSQVFYRKWRPQTFSEVVGQEHITQTLLNALATGRVAHAYLFCGPRGTGKTSTGRILAKAVNCLENGKGEPCNACIMCQGITESRSMDLVEIDAASNRGIDEIRGLREKANYSPTEARYKVYIVDEMHMLTDPAFNALLKTLEEPPPHVIFVLATTEPHKVPSTAISRCQRFDFRRIPLNAVVKRLEHICEKEGIKTEPAVLSLIARSATGSLRDAENLLEQLVVRFGQNIEMNHMQALLGVWGELPIKEFVGCIVQKDVPLGLSLINRVNNSGQDLRQFQRELLEYLRGLLLTKAGATQSVDAPQETLADMKVLASQISMPDLLKTIKLFGQLDLRLDSQATLPLETALAECSLPSPPEVEPTTGEARRGKRGEGVIPSRITHRQIAQEEKEQVQKAAPTIAQQVVPTAEEASHHDIPQVEEKPTESTATHHELSPPEAEASPGVKHFQQRWGELVAALRGTGSKGSLDALLRNACEPIALEGNTVVVGFYHEFHMSKIEDPKYRHLVEQKLREVFGSPYKMRCVLTPKSKKTPEAPKGHLVKAVMEIGGKIVEGKPPYTQGQEET